MRLCAWVFNAVSLVLVLVMIVLATSLAIHSPPANFRSYDCSMAEFHPDYSVKVKQACRQQLQQARENNR
jgi:hypothetical protein